jgi:hypothetical protein
MKIKSFLFTLAMAGSCFAETKTEPNPEIEKIDARLAVLQGFYNEENGIINRLTNFKRKPIQKGTPAYNEFLVADQRMRQIAVEAKALKERKSAILAGEATLNDEATLEAVHKGFPTLSWKIVDQQKSPGGRYFLEGDHVIDSLPANTVDYSKDAHGLRVKGVFVGMPYQQAKPILEKLCTETLPKGGYKAAKRVKKSESGWSVNYTHLSPKAFEGHVLESYYESVAVNIELDSAGVITKVVLGSPLFNTGESSLEDFVKACSSNFGVSFEPEYSTQSLGGEVSRNETRYVCKLETGHEIQIASSSMQVMSFSQLDTGGLRASNMQITLSKKASIKDLKKEFE